MAVTQFNLHPRLELVHEVLRDLANREKAHSSSALDDIFSRVINIQMRVGEPLLTYMMSPGGNCSPCVIFYTNKLTDPNMTPLSIDWSAPHLLNALGSVFGALLKTEWVRTTVTYEP